MAGEQTIGEPSPGGQVLIYQDGALNLQVRLEGQTVWLTQRLIADLYQTSVPEYQSAPGRRFTKIASLIPPQPLRNS